MDVDIDTDREVVVVMHIYNRGRGTRGGRLKRCDGPYRASQGV